MSFFETHPELIAPTVAALSLTPLLIALGLRYLTKVRIRRAATEELSRDPTWAVFHAAQLVRAPSLEELIDWARAGRLLANDQVWNPSTHRWSQAQSYPGIAESIKEHLNERRTPSI